MTDTEEAIAHLLNVWEQYNSWHSENGKMPHANMGAGEDAAEFLEGLGYGHDDGYSFVPNDKARALMDKV